MQNYSKIDKIAVEPKTMCINFFTAAFQQKYEIEPNFDTVVERVALILRYQEALFPKESAIHKSPSSRFSRSQHQKI